MTLDIHPLDPKPLATLELTTMYDVVSRNALAKTFARRNGSLSGYVLLPTSPRGFEFYRIHKGAATLSTLQECAPRTWAAMQHHPHGPIQVVLGFDAREDLPYRVACESIRRSTSEAVAVTKLDIRKLIERGWYTRPTDRRVGRLIDVRSADDVDVDGKPMATEHAIARFFTPAIFDFKGWALSADCDILVRFDLRHLFALADDRFAVMVVKHYHDPTETTKMDGQVQSIYARKNWSSVILWNCAHPAHLVLRPGEFGILNRWPGRDLHAFRWLQDDEIGELPREWNHLVGVTSLPFEEARAAVGLAHFTLGTPDMPGYESCDFASEWRALAEAV